MRIPTIICTVSIALLYGCHPAEKQWPEEKSPEVISLRVIDDLLSRNEFMMYDTRDVKAIHYAEVCTAFGAARLAALMGNDTIIEKLSDRYRVILKDSIPNTANHVDANVYGILPLELYLHTRDTAYFRQGMDLAIHQWDNPLPNGLTGQTRFWIDDVWMIGSLQIQAYRATGDTVFLNRAARETAAYLKKLQKHNGLFYHGENAPFFWGRGNGWVAAGLAEVMSELPEDHPLYPQILQAYKKMMNALLSFQCEDGMWRQLIDVDTAWKETSCTGMFGYAITMGLKKGILPEDEFSQASRKAWLALTDYVNPEGQVSQVCVGTGQSTDINYYLTRPTVTGDFHGQAPLLWFAYSLMLQSQ